MQLTRFLDAESVDPSLLNQEIGNFVRELHTQFLHGKAWEIEGYAKHIMQTLRSGALYSLTQGQCHQLVLHPGVCEAALREFKPWVQICESVCRAEFPHFDIFNSMLVFNLNDGNRAAASTSTEACQCLKRIALALDLDPFAFKTEWERMRPVALAQKEKRPRWTTGMLGKKPSGLRKKIRTSKTNMQLSTCRRPSKRIFVGAHPRHSAATGIVIFHF